MQEMLTLRLVESELPEVLMVALHLLVYSVLVADLPVALMPELLCPPSGNSQTPVAPLWFSQGASFAPASMLG
jgi:hypothetical protein